MLLAILADRHFNLPTPFHGHMYSLRVESTYYKIRVYFQLTKIAKKWLTNIKYFVYFLVCFGKEMNMLVPEIIRKKIKKLF